MRILLAIHNVYTDATSGAAHSIRILMQWLAEGGHECRVLSTARFDAKAPTTIEDHLTQLGVPLQRTPASKAFVRTVKKPANVVVGRPTIDFTLAGVAVTMLLTKAEMRSTGDRFESEQFVFLFDRLLEQFAPDVVLSYGDHPVVREAMRRGQAFGAATVFTLRNRGYDREHFAHVDHVFTSSPYLSDAYRRSIGLRSTGIELPLDW